MSTLAEMATDFSGFALYRAESLFRTDTVLDSKHMSASEALDVKRISIRHVRPSAHPGAEGRSIHAAYECSL